MQKLEFLIEGSQGDKYRVLFEKSDSNLNVYCSCPAGEKGTYCKHRFALMDGEIDTLLSDNEHDVAKIKEFIKNTDVESAYREVIDTQKQCDQIQNQLKSAKKKLAKAMYG